MSIPFRQAPFTITGGTANRSLDEWFGDIVNAKAMGAIGNGIADDTEAVQAAFNLAFGSPPNGWDNRHLNRPVYFPAGKYNIDDTLVLTKVVGGHIYGAGKHSTQFIWTGPIAAETSDVFTPMLTLNGCADLCLEKMSLFMANGGGGGDNTCVLNIDWDEDDSGNGCDGSHDNHFQELALGNGQYTVVIGRAGDTGSEGHNNLFLNCTVTGSGVRSDYGYHVRGPAAHNNQIIGGGAPYFVIAAVCCPSGGGSIHAQGMSNTESGVDFLMESGKVMYISQTRTESFKLLRMENGVVTIHASTGTSGMGADAIEINGGKCIIQGCDIHDAGQITGTGGELYLGANYFGSSTTPLSGYTGDIIWDPDLVDEP